MSTDSGHELTYDSIYQEGQAEVRCITWKIKKFSSFLNSNNTPEFRTKIIKTEQEDSTCNNIPEPNFQLKMRFLGTKNDVIQIYYLSNSTYFLKTNLYAVVQYSTERSIVTNEFKTVEANKWYFLTQISKHELWNSSEPFVNNYGHFVLIFKFMIAKEVTVQTPNDTKANLGNDLEHLLNVGTYSDVTMRSADGTEYKLHKAIIASRSAVLKAHFDHNTTECSTNVIESPFNADVLKELLLFIYTDKVPKMYDISEKLLAAADFYQLEQLKCLCEITLYEKLTMDNVIEILQLADLHSAQHLKELIMEFIRNGQQKLITESKGWSQIDSPKLIKEIYKAVIFGDDKERDIEFVSVTE